MSYQKTPIIDETAAVPLGTQPPTTMTMGRRSSKTTIAIIAGMLMLLMVAGGGTVWMRPSGALYDHFSGSRVPQPNNRARCDGKCIGATPFGCLADVPGAYALGCNFNDGGCYYQMNENDFYPNDGFCTYKSYPCQPAVGTFNGISIDSAKSNPFETCFQFGDEDKYCWTKSYYHLRDYYSDNYWDTCVPIGKDWHSVGIAPHAKSVNPVTQPNLCGDPCQLLDQPDIPYF